MTLAAGGGRPASVLPQPACDCHMHVFGPAERYPPSPQRSYTPREAPLAEYDRMAAELDLQRLVLVQASAYGTDNRCMLDAIEAAGPRARGVVALDPAAGNETLKELDRRGVRGVRINFVSGGMSAPSLIKETFVGTARRIAELGWHVEMFTDLPRLAGLAAQLRASPVPIVIDHMGLAQGSLGVAQPGFDVLLDLVAAGNCWVKLSGAYRVSTQEPDFPDAGTLARQLIGANPERVLWGSDWPHTAPHPGKPMDNAPLIDFRPIDERRLMALLADWAGNAETLERILVRNPAGLYRF